MGSLHIFTETKNHRLILIFLALFIALFALGCALYVFYQWQGETTKKKRCFFKEIFNFCILFCFLFFVLQSNVLTHDTLQTDTIPNDKTHIACVFNVNTRTHETHTHTHTAQRQNRKSNKKKTH